MNGMRNISRRTAIVIAVAAGLVVLAAGAAFTAAFTVSTDKLGAGATATAGCDTNGITAGVASPMTWSIGSPPGTTVVQYSLTNVDTACNGKRWKATLGSVSDLVCIAQGSGTLTVSSGAATIDLSSAGVGCAIPAPPSATSGVGSLTVTFYD